MSIWSTFVNILFPLPLVALVILSIPLPFYKHQIRKFVLRSLDSVIFFKITGNLTVYQLATGISGILFLISAADTFKGTKYEKSTENFLTSERLRCTRWRSERNFWIAFFSFTLWLILYRVRSLMHEVENSRLHTE